LSQKNKSGSFRWLCLSSSAAPPTRECPCARYEKSTARTVARARRRRPTPSADIATLCSPWKWLAPHLPSGGQHCELAKDPMHQKSIPSVVAGGRGFSASPMRRSDVLHQNEPRPARRCVASARTPCTRTDRRCRRRSARRRVTSAKTPCTRTQRSRPHRPAPWLGTPNARWHRGRRARRRAIALRLSQVTRRGCGAASTASPSPNNACDLERHPVLLVRASNTTWVQWTTASNTIRARCRRQPSRIPPLSSPMSWDIISLAEF
jgi:hypothetical protein